MKNIIKRLICTVLVLFVCHAVLLPVLEVNAAEGYGETLNLANVKQHEKGRGYYWDNRKKILTLDGFNLSTSSDLGLKLPENATVELVGTNRISASKYALSFTGNVTFTGKGTLIIDSGDVGIYSYSSNTAHKIRLNGGKLNVNGDRYAILSEKSEISVTGGTLEVSSDSGTSVMCRVFGATGGTITSSGTIHATHQILINAANVEASAENAPALLSDNLFSLEYVKLSCGDSASVSAGVEIYNGESYVSTEAVSKGPRSSILFGEGTPITVDYILLALSVLLFSGAIVVPILVKRAKTKRLYEELAVSKTESKK